MHTYIHTDTHMHICWMLLSNQNFELKLHDVEWVEVVMGVAWGNIQQISYIPQMEQHSPFGLMLLCLENVTIMCMRIIHYIYLCTHTHTYTLSYTQMYSGGIYTPSVALGNTNIIQNLENTGKVKFEVLQN